MQRGSPIRQSKQWQNLSLKLDIGYTLSLTSKTTTITGRSWISTRRNAQQQHAHTTLICPTTLSKYKHGAFTVLLVLKSGRWQPIMFENFVIVLIMFVNPLLKQSSQTFLLITQSCSSNNNTLNWLANNSWKSKARNECSQARSVQQKGFESLLLLQSSIKKKFTNNNMTKRKLVTSWCLQYLL